MSATRRAMGAARELAASQVRKDLRRNPRRCWRRGMSESVVALGADTRSAPNEALTMRPMQTRLSPDRRVARAAPRSCVVARPVSIVVPDSATVRHRSPFSTYGRPSATASPKGLVTGTLPSQVQALDGASRRHDAHRVLDASADEHRPDLGCCLSAATASRYDLSDTSFAYRRRSRAFSEPRRESGSDLAHLREPEFAGQTSGVATPRRTAPCRPALKLLGQTSRHRLGLADELIRGRRARCADAFGPGVPRHPNRGMKPPGCHGSIARA